MKADVVIIGGGVAGLATGALLAKAGRRVIVLEKGNRPGGRAYTYEDKGFTLNYGPHAVYRTESGLLADVFRRLGRPPLAYGYPEPLRSYWADGDRFGSVGAKPHQALLTQLFPIATRLKLGPLMAKLRFARAQKLGDMTYGESVARTTGDPLLRRFALALGTVNSYTRPASALSARWLVGHLQRSLFARDYVGYMSGGWRMMYDAFLDELQAGGSAVVTGAAVERLEFTDGRVVAAIAAGDRYEGGAFVCTLPPQEAPGISAEHSGLAAELRSWAKLEDVRALCMDLGFSRRVRTDLSFVYDIERDLYYSLHSEVTPDLAPEGAQLLHAMAYLSSEEAADEALRKERERQLVAGLDRYFSGWHDVVLIQRTVPNVRVASARQTPEQQRGRVPLRSAVAENLYFAGDARDIPYDLSEISLASAIEVADAIGAQRPAAHSRAAVVA